MDLKLNRIGKIAIMASITDKEEEQIMKQFVSGEDFNYKLAVTFVSGITTEIKSSFIKSIVGCALQNDIIPKDERKIHSLVHAGIDALAGVMNSVPAEGSLKLKVAIVTDGQWLAVALYGDSAYYPLTNHERACLGIMHL